jgi:hypothetical protein
MENSGQSSSTTSNVSNSSKEKERPKIKVSDIKFPVIIYDLDNDKKNKIMNALHVKWGKTEDPECVGMWGDDSIRISLQNGVLKGKYSRYCGNEYKDQKISYNDIIFDDESKFRAGSNKKIHYTEIKKPFVIGDLNQDSNRCRTVNDQFKMGFTFQEPLTRGVEYASSSAINSSEGWMDESGWYKGEHNYKNYNFYSYDDIDWDLYFKISIKEHCKTKFVIPDEEEILDFKVNHNRKSFTLPNEE